MNLTNRIRSTMGLANKPSFRMGLYTVFVPVSRAIKHQLAIKW